MTRARKSIDVSNSPELLKLAEEVRDSGEPCLLRKGRRQVAVLLPAPGGTRVRRGRQRTEADHQAFLASMGSWADLIDVDRFLADIRASRDMPPRPPVDL